ncbi:hypothetical protein FKW77_010861 [Venturia effusa]|uniref:Uncharacterized protein n=1 Tax=Venturia effusa TaxID=50376 RepID=A0A517KYP0_9PEZI|nr:hypothetical protein FKW77_010861 [Venturia effusa]
MDTFLQKLEKHGIRVSADEPASKRQKMDVEETAADGDVMEDIQMADGASISMLSDVQMIEGDSRTTKDGQQKPEKDTPKRHYPTAMDIIPEQEFLKLPAEMRQLIYEAYLSDCQTVNGLIYQHPAITNPSSLPPAPTYQNKAAPTTATSTETQIEQQITNTITTVLKPHPFVLLNNHQITSEYSGAARKYMIHALTIPVTTLHLLPTWPSTTIPRAELTRLKLTIDFGRLTNDVDHARVRADIVAFVHSMPKLVDLQILFVHELVRDVGTGLLLNDWQVVRRMLNDDFCVIGAL